MTTPTLTEIDPTTFDRYEVDQDGFAYPVNDLPAEEWECADCHAPIGMLLHESDDGAAWLRWTAVFVPADSDPLTTPTRYCEDCAGDQA